MPWGVICEYRSKNSSLVGVGCGLKTHDPLCRSLVWEGDWRTDIFMASLKEMDKGNCVKLVLTVDGQVKETRTSSLLVLGHKPLQLCQLGTKNFISYPLIFLLFTASRQRHVTQIC